MLFNQPVKSYSSRAAPAAAGPLCGTAARPVLLLLACLQGLPAPGAAASEAGAFKVTEVADGNFVHSGVHAGLDDARRDDVANIGFVIGDRCVAIIDTGGSLRVGELLRQAVRERTQRPICYVINTHAHYDHVLGNAAFRDQKPVYVGHAGLPAEIAASTPFFVENFAPELGPEPEPGLVIAPSLTVSDHAELQLGGRTLQLIAHASAHSHTDLTVLDSATGTLWLGDLLFVDRIPALDGSLRGWIEVLEALREREVRNVVPGHGPPSVPWPAAMEAEYAYLAGLRDHVRGAIADGRFMEEVLRDLDDFQEGAWQLHDQHHGRNVSRAFSELEWE